MHQIFKTLFCYKTLHVSGIFCAHHQELHTVHTAIGMFHAGYVTSYKQSQVGTEFQPDLFGSTKFFPRYFINGTIFEKKKVIQHKMCALIFCTNLSETSVIPKRIKWHMIKNMLWSSCTMSIFLSDFLWNLNFSQRIFEKYSKYQISWKFMDWEQSCSMLTDGRTWRNW
jgi:hypothetical protein